MSDKILTKTYNPGSASNPVNIVYDGESMSVSDDELYKNTPMISFLSEYYQGEGASEENWSHYYISETIIHPDPLNGRMALYYLSDNTVPQVVATPYTSPYVATVTFDCKTTLEYQGSSYDSWAYNLTSLGLGFGGGNIRRGETHFATNIPVFLTAEAAWNYVNAPSDASALLLLADAINYVGQASYESDTKNYFISNLRGQANCVRNVATAISDTAWRSIRFQANDEPLLYYNDDYSLTLYAPSVVASYSLPAPVYVIDNVPESSWHDYLDYTGLWYGNIASRLDATGTTLVDGQYMYGFELSTNIYVFKDRASAEDAIQSGDYSGAVNYANISGGGSYNPPDFGTEEQTTTFGEGADTSPFMQTYVLGRSALIQVAQAWYNTTPQTITEILTGLKMFGDLPQEALAGVTMYPFDVSKILNTSPQSYIYFGTYQLQLGTSIEKAISLKSNAYLDCGSIYLAPLFHSYKDFYCTTLDVYLPYIGWERMDISLLIGKNVSVRYYVDIHTRACVAVILANGVFVAQYAGNIGTGLPTCGSDYQGYANAMASTILGGASNVYSGAKGATGATMGMLGNMVSGAGLATSIMGGVGGVALGIGAAAANTAATLAKMESMGTPADHPQIKGGFTSCLGAYLPQSILWRYIIHDTVEPDSFNELCGRPSSASGNVGSFGGFLSCKSVNLNTNGMLDDEAAEVYSLLKNGIYV